MPAIGYAGDERLVYSLGYVGHGVSMTHLNGRLLSDFILEQKTPLTDAFFVNRKTIPLPPDPFRRMIASAICGYLRLGGRRYDPKIGRGYEVQGLHEKLGTTATKMVTQAADLCRSH